MVERFWGKGNRYTDADRQRIARQFAKIDHGLDGEKDWTRWLKTGGGAMECDYAAWTTFYQFCRGWVDGYTDMTVSNGKRTETVKAFYTEYTKKWVPVEGYIEHPYNCPYIPQEYIQDIQDGGTK